MQNTLGLPRIIYPYTLEPAAERNMLENTTTGKKLLHFFFIRTRKI